MDSGLGPNGGSSKAVCGGGELISLISYCVGISPTSGMLPEGALRDLPWRRKEAICRKGGTQRPIYDELVERFFEER
eukprot:705513-Karenia_brevis.AAC.1